MTPGNLLLSSALYASLALTPLALHARNYDAWALDREVLNSAANYTGVLTTAHGQVRKYITWNWRTSLSEDEQRVRTSALLHEITTRQQITRSQPSESPMGPSGSLVPSLDMTVLDSFDVRFRYCDSKLLSYFAAGFKHGLSGQQIIDAPVLRAQRAGRTFNGEPLGIVESNDGALRLQTYGGRSTPIPACMATGYGGALPDGTVAYMTSAHGKFDVARTRRQRETRTSACPAPQVGPGIKQQRWFSTDYNARGDRLYNPQSPIPYDPEDEDFDFSYLDTAALGGDGHWRTRYNHCRAPGTFGVRRVEACRASEGGTMGDGTATYEYFFTEAYDPDFAGTDDFAKTVWLPSDREGNFIDAPVGHLVGYLSFCGDQNGPNGDSEGSRVMEPRISRRLETRPGVCRAPYRRGTVTQTREVEMRRWSFADSPDVVDFPALSEVMTESEGPWAVSEDLCYRNVNERTTETRVSSCASGYSGTVNYQRIKTVTGVDWRSDGWQDQLSSSYTRWTSPSRNCQRQSGGGRNRDDDSGYDYDVDGDGRADFANTRTAGAYIDKHGGRIRRVSGGCGSCDGPTRTRNPEHDRSDSDSGGSGGSSRSSGNTRGGGDNLVQRGWKKVKSWWGGR